MKAVLNATAAAYYLDIPEGTLRQLCSQGKVPHKKRGDRLIFLIRDLDAWLAALPGQGVAEAIAAWSGGTMGNSVPSQVPAEDHTAPPSSPLEPLQRRVPRLPPAPRTRHSYSGTATRLSPVNPQFLDLPFRVRVNF